MIFGNGVIDIQAAAYNGARTVITWHCKVSDNQPVQQGKLVNSTIGSTLSKHHCHSLLAPPADIHKKLN